MAVRRDGARIGRMSRHFLFALALVSVAACATPTVGDQTALVAQRSDRALSKQERQWLAAGHAEDMVSYEQLGLGEPSTVIMLDDVGYGLRSAAGGDQAANLSSQTITNCARQGMDCVDDDDYLLDWTFVN